jgi:hypothetical protein
VESYALATVKEAHNFKQIGRTRVARRTEHAHKAFRRNVRGLGKVELASLLNMIKYVFMFKKDGRGEHESGAG